MKQFGFDDIGNNETLTYTLSPEETLDQVTLEMMNHNTINGLLPMRFWQMNEMQVLRYDTKGMETLEFFLSHNVNSSKIIRILKSLADSLMNAQKYMIEECSFVFEEKYIFIGSDEKGQLVCLPVEGRSRRGFQEFCRAIINLPQVANGLKYRFYSQIDKYLCGVQFSVKEFAMLLENTELESAIIYSDYKEGLKKQNDSKGIVLGKDERNSNNKNEQDIKKNQITKDGPIILSRDGGIISDSGETAFISLPDNIQNISLDEEVTVYLPNNGLTKGYLVRKSTQEKVVISKDEFVIGKSRKDIDYHICDNPTISRYHAKIIQRGNFFAIIDTNSKNHTYVNKKMIESNREVELKDGTNIRLSDEDFMFFIEK